MIYLNGVEVKFEKFPNGETKFDSKQFDKNVYHRNQIKLKYEDDSDLIKLLFVKRYLDDHQKGAFLVITYMPYSRMDRVEGDAVFTLKYVSNLINLMNFESVEIIEPHSDVSTALLNRGYATFPTFELIDNVVKDIGFDIEKDFLFYPDNGAAKRYSKVKGYKYLVGHKHRNFQTGEIESLQIVGDTEQLPGKKVIIVDDLTSYGTTFYKSGEQLKNLGALEVYLLVAHAEYSVYKGKLLTTDVIDKIYTTNSILNESKHEKIHVFKL